MIRILESRIIEGNKSFVNIACLSTESKPVGDYVTGSKLTEADTGAEFMFDEESKAWNQTGAGYTAPSND